MYIQLGHVEPKCAFEQAQNVWIHIIFRMRKVSPRKLLSIDIQSNLVISNSKWLTETLRDIHTSTYQSWESEENTKLNNHI